MPVSIEAAKRQCAVTRQYDELIAANYDRDPQNVTRGALGRALAHLADANCLGVAETVARTLDVGMGTGLFLEMLRQRSARAIAPHGLDVSAQMTAIACRRIPDLHAVIDDAANLEHAFPDRQFDLISTHFVTGFVPLARLAPQVWDKLTPGGHWSFVGGTSAGYPELQRKANSPMLRVLFKGRRVRLDDLLTPPTTRDAAQAVHSLGFEVLHEETFMPELRFGDFDEFMEFAYQGGWLTPLIEELGLHQASPALRAVLNKLAFPLNDCHKIAVILARKPSATPGEQPSKLGL
jgi:hypothetical protein